MFIEFTEYLRCPRPHAPEWLVLVPGTMAGRHVVAGTLGCPVCKAEYAIRDRVVRFGTPPEPAAAGPLPAPDVVQALLGLESPGGYVALVGSAAGLAAGLGPLLAGVHLVAVNAPAPPSPAVTALETAGDLPLRDRVLRGVVVGAERAGHGLDDAARVVLNGQRVVALIETVPPAERLDELACGRGLWVGRRR